MAEHYIYTMVARLCDYEPSMWRRFVINGERTMAELAYVLMILFEMKEKHFFSIHYHLSQNDIKKMEEDLWRPERYTKDICYLLTQSTYNHQDHERVVFADKTTLFASNHRDGSRLIFTYNTWHIDLVIESCEKQEISLSAIPYVCEGSGAGIIEDVGGAYGLKRLHDALALKTGEDYDLFMSWLGNQSLDLDTFDIHDMNYRLKKLVRVYKNMYQRHIIPSKPFMDLLYRK